MIIKQRGRERFGDAVVLELVDLESDQAGAADIKVKINKEGLALPLLLVNEEVRISGEFDARQLMDIIEVEKELKWETNSM